MTGTDGSPVQRQRFATSEADLIEQTLNDMYIGNGLRLDPVAIGDEIGFQTGSAGDLQAARVRTTTGFAADTEPMHDHVVVQYFTGGRFAYDFDRGDMLLCGSGGDSMLVPDHTVQSFHSPGMEVLTLRIPIARIRAAAATHYGADAAGLRFTGVTPLTPALDRYWNSLARQVQLDLLDAPDPALAHPLLAEQTSTMLATALLAVFPHTAMTRTYQPGPGSTSPAALARAVDHLHAHPHTPISVTELAEIAGVTPRALQYAFRTHHDTTPLGYHRQVRLEAAHRDLLAADPAAGDTVAAIAARWGFPSAGRFSGYYQRRYGRTPGQTLRSR